MSQTTFSATHRTGLVDRPSTDDHSATFKVLRAGLAHADGRTYQEFVRGLKPAYTRVWRDIALGYGMLFAGCIACVMAARTVEPGAVAMAMIAVAGAIHIGYWVAYLQLFIHEGAHHNLAADRTTNDRICNVLIGWMVGSTVQNYRTVHFQHHRALGTVDDSEFSYFFAFNLMFVVKAIVGIRVLEVIAARRTYVANGAPKKAADPTAGSFRFAVLGIAMHLVIMAILGLAGGVAPVLAWVIGVGSIFPLFGALRQLLEHRDEQADPSADYTSQNHGAMTRIFGTGLFASTFGGAGFNRHLLHHWEPQVSYTRLAELEAFLLGTKVGPIIETRRSRYGDAALRLFSLR